VQAGERHFVEGELGRKRRDGPDTVAGGTGALRVAARAEVAFAGRTNAVLAEPVAVVNEVAHGRRVLAREVLVAAVAVTKRPLILVLVTSEARRHLGPDRVRVLFRDGLMTTDAITVRRGLVSAVLEAQMLASQQRALPRIGGSMAPEARTRVVWLGVTPDTCRVGRKVQRFDVTRGGHSPVAIQAIDPTRRVRAMLEGVRRVARPEPEDASARRQRDGGDDENRERALHGVPQVRESLASALASYRCSGVEEASTAAAASQPARR
jgi:hypothetical protein